MERQSRQTQKPTEVPSPVGITAIAHTSTSDKLMIGAMLVAGTLFALGMGAETGDMYRENQAKDTTPSPSPSMDLITSSQMPSVGAARNLLGS